MTNGEARTDGRTVAAAAFDLEERTAAFGEAVVAFAKKIPRSPVNNPLISQVVRSAGSVGAN